VRVVTGLATRAPGFSNGLREGPPGRTFTAVTLGGASRAANVSQGFAIEERRPRSLAIRALQPGLGIALFDLPTGRAPPSGWAGRARGPTFRAS